MDKRGYSPVEMSIILDGKRTYMVLPRKERPAIFRKEYMARGKNELKEFCDEFYRRVNTSVSEMYRKGLVVSSKGIKAYMRGDYETVYSVSMLCADFLGSIKGRVGINLSLSNYRKYEKVCACLKWMVDADQDISAINRGVVMDILNKWRLEYEASSVSNYFVKLKSILSYGVDNGKIVNNPASGIKVSKGEKKIEIIGDNEYERIRDKDISIARVERVRDLFIFACNSGLSYSDCCGLVKGDFKQVDGDRWVIEKERVKTGVRFYSVILPDGVRILEKYNWDLSMLKISNQKTNLYLKEIGDVCDIYHSLTFHKARHFYITKLIRMGVPVSVVQLCAGHSNIAMTNKYTHLVCEDVVRAVSERL